MKIQLSEFGGMAPKIEPRRLSEKLATRAENVSFESGALGLVPIGTLPSTDFSALSPHTRSILRPAAGDTRLAFTTGETTGEAFSSLVAPIDTWGRVYFTDLFGPRFTVEENYTPGGIETDPISYRLGIPPPQFVITPGTPVYTLEPDVILDPVKVAYTCTFVDKYGHESAPVTPSTIVEIPANGAFTLALNFVAESLPQTNLDGAVRRLYRAAFDGSSSAWQFIADVPFAFTTWTDNVLFGDEAEELVSTDWVPPPSDLKQMIPVASNYVAGFIGNLVCYSEFRLPHAWPEQYRFPLKYDVVGLKQTSNGMLIATTGKPYWAFGPDPASAVPAELDANHPCLSAKSMVDMGDYVIYASHDGLVAISGQEVKILTEDYIDRRTWLRDFAPDGIVAFAYEGQYVFSVGNQWWMFSPAENAGFTLLTQMSVLPSDLRQAYYDTIRDTTVLLNTSGQAFDVVSMDGGEYVWKSRTFETPPINLGVARVLATGYPVTLTVTAGAVAEAYTIADDRPIRLVSGSRATSWAFEVRSTHRVTDVAVCHSPQELID